MGVGTMVGCCVGSNVGTGVGGRVYSTTIVLVLVAEAASVEFALTV